MKSIAVVLILFGFVATGIGVYFIRQSQVTSTESKAYDTVKPLGKLVETNCDFMYLENCKIKNDASLLTFVPTQVESVLKAYGSPALLAYRESVAPDAFSKLGNPIALPIQESYSAADIISRVSIASGINYKVLITLLATQGRRAWEGDAPASNPFGRRELSFADQMIAVAMELSSTYKMQADQPTPIITKSNKVIRFDIQNMNLGSRTLYIYLAKSLSDAEFTAITADPLSSDTSFTNAWLKLFP